MKQLLLFTCLLLICTVSKGEDRECITCESFKDIITLSDSFIPISKHLNPLSLDSLKQKQSTMELLKEISLIEESTFFFQTGSCLSGTTLKQRNRRRDPYNIHLVIEKDNRFDFIFHTRIDLRNDIINKRRELKDIFKNISKLSIKEKLLLAEELFKQSKLDDLKHLLSFLGITKRKFTMKELAEVKASFLERAGVYDINFISYIGASGSPVISIIAGIYQKYGIYNGNVHKVSSFDNPYGNARSKVYDRNWKSLVITGDSLPLSYIPSLKGDVGTIIFHGEDGVDYHWLASDNSNSALIAFISSNTITNEEQEKLKQYLNEEYIYINEVDVENIMPVLTIGLSKDIIPAANFSVTLSENNVESYTNKIAQESLHKYRGNIGVDILDFSGGGASIKAGSALGFSYDPDTLESLGVTTNVKFATVAGELSNQDASLVAKAIYEAGTISDTLIGEFVIKKTGGFLPVTFTVGHRSDFTNRSTPEQVGDKHKSFAQTIFCLKPFQIDGDLVFEFNSTNYGGNSEQENISGNAGSIKFSFPSQQ